MEKIKTFARIISAYASRSDGLALRAVFSHLPDALAKICRAEKGKCAHRKNCVHREYEQSTRTGYWVVFRTKLVTYYAIVGIGRPDANRIATKLRRLKNWTDEAFRRTAARALPAY